MEIIPRIVKIGGALGFIGGVISIICMAIFFKADDNALVSMSAYMLIAVMFFALGGGFAKNGNWSWNMLVFMTFLTIAVVCCSVIFNATDLYASIIMVVVGVLIIIGLSMPSSKTWATRMRI